MPPYGQAGNAVGNVAGITPSNYSKYAVAIFINVNNGWWTKPYFATPLTTIQSNGTWTVNVTTGGSDTLATGFTAYLVPSGFAIPTLSGQSSLPASLSVFPIASTTRAPIPFVGSITLSPLTASLTVSGATQQIAATTLDQNGKPIIATLTWASSNISVATVSSTGLVTPVGAGTASISATSSGVNSTYPSIITITKPVPVLKTITLSPLTASLTVNGATQQIAATTLDQNGKPITATLTWASSNTSVATVSSTGLVTAVGAGTTNITASSETITSTAPSVITAVNPSISITSVPKMAKNGNATGSITGILAANYSKYAVAVFIKVAGGWWNKPTFAAPLTTIKSNGTWTADVTTGGNDTSATEFRAYLVPSSFSVPLLSGTTIFPTTLSSYTYSDVTR